MKTCGNVAAVETAPGTKLNSEFWVGRALSGNRRNEDFMPNDAARFDISRANRRKRAEVRRICDALRAPFLTRCGRAPQADVARSLGIPVGAIGTWVRGGNLPTAYIETVRRFVEGR